MLAWLYCAATRNVGEEAPRHHGQELYLPERLDGRGVTIKIWSAARPKHARKDHRVGSIQEIYTFLKQADARELRHIFIELDEAREAGQPTDAILERIDQFETHVVPIIADIDAGFGNEEATYLLAKKMIEAGLARFKSKTKSLMPSSVDTRMARSPSPRGFLGEN